MKRTSMARKKHRVTLAIDVGVLEQMQSYCVEHEIDLADLVARTWHLWNAATGLVPTYPRYKDPLDTFLEQIQQEADELDEEYKGE
jgi:predicted GNAT family N-acyltransferase